MSPLSDVKVQAIDGRNWKILQSFTVFWSGGAHQVEAGEITDFASIPRILWRLIPPWDLSLRAAAAHDSIYRRPEVDYTKEQADRMFFEAMGQDGVPKWQQWAMWAGVRVGGWAAYKPRIK